MNESREKVGENLSKNEEKILEIIIKNNTVSYADMSRMINITEKSVYTNIIKLKEKGLLKRIGPDKGGYLAVTLKKNKK